MNGKDNDSFTLSPSDLESAFSGRSLDEKEDSGCDPRFSIHIHSIRKRLADPDGISAKAVIDGIVKAGILEDDSAKHVKEVVYSQEKVAKGGEEKTVVTIERYLDLRGTE